MTDTLGELEKVAVAAVVHDGAQAGLPARARRSLPALRAAARRSQPPRQRRGQEGRARRARSDRRARPAAAARGAARREGHRAAADRRPGARPPRQQGRRGAARPHGAAGAAEGSAPHRHARRRALDREVRVEALVAAGRLGDAGVIDDVLPLMEHQRGRDARGRDVHARPLRRQARGRAAAQGARRSPRLACRCSRASASRRSTIRASAPR